MRTERRGSWAAVADATRLPLAARAFDTALALDVLEHTDDDAVVREIARVLKPGGRLLVTVPAFQFLWSARDEDAGHRRRYSRRGIVALLEAAKLEVVEIRVYQCLLLPAMILTRLLGKRWRRPARLEERPAAWFNRCGLAINQFEIRAGDFVAWPWGSSLAAVARKPV